MPYLNIVFHNIRHGPPGGAPIHTVTSRADYTSSFVMNMNAFQSGGVGGNTTSAPTSMPQSAGWGTSVTGTNTACGIFFCESNDYAHGDYTNWQGVGGGASAIPVFPVSALSSGYTPWRTGNTRCVFLEGNPDTPGIGVPVTTIPAQYVSAHWIGSNTQALRCLGTGDSAILGPSQAPWGNDRYGIFFQAAYRTYPGTLRNPITGLFVHTKNTYADSGTQIAVLCRKFPQAIIFGDLNLDLEADLKHESLSEAVGRTHRILAIKHHTSGNYYPTHFTRSSTTRAFVGTGCLDYALVPNAYVAHVELWARGTNTLSRNGSDHAYMMLRIRCT